VLVVAAFFVLFACFHLVGVHLGADLTDRIPRLQPFAVFPRPVSAPVTERGLLMPKGDDVAVSRQPDRFTGFDDPPQEDGIRDRVGNDVFDLGPEVGILFEPVPQIGRVETSWLTFQATFHSSLQIASDQSPFSHISTTSVSDEAGSTIDAPIRSGANFS